jgi:hypothetical protein
MSSRESREFGVPAWVRAGHGQMPSVPWTFVCEAPLTGLALARESSEIFVADESKALQRLDANGELLSLTRLPGVARLLVVSDDGNWGTAVVDDGTVYRFDRGLEAIWELELSEPCLAVALSPFGHHLAAALADGQTEIFNERKRRLARFETVRPLAHLQFCSQSPILFGAAEHGLVGCYDLSGAELWQERFWSNVGDLCITGDGDLIYLAGSTHGIQTMDGDGGTVGAYVVEGTVREIGDACGCCGAVLRRLWGICGVRDGRRGCEHAELGRAVIRQFQNPSPLIDAFRHGSPSGGSRPPLAGSETASLSFARSLENAGGCAFSGTFATIG